MNIEELKAEIEAASTKEELLEVLRRNNVPEHEMIKVVGDHDMIATYSGELSDDELDAVTGGVDLQAATNILIKYGFKKIKTLLFDNNEKNEDEML